MANPIGVYDLSYIVNPVRPPFTLDASIPLESTPLYTKKAVFKQFIYTAFPFMLIIAFDEVKVNTNGILLSSENKFFSINDNLQYVCKDIVTKRIIEQRVSVGGIDEQGTEHPDVWVDLKAPSSLYWGALFDQTLSYSQKDLVIMAMQSMYPEQYPNVPTFNINVEMDSESPDYRLKPLVVGG